jgi:hypothetical protein
MWSRSLQRDWRAYRARCQQGKCGCSRGRPPNASGAGQQARGRVFEYWHVKTFLFQMESDRRPRVRRTLVTLAAAGESSEHGSPHAVTPSTDPMVAPTHVEGLPSVPRRLRRAGLQRKCWRTTYFDICKSAFRPRRVSCLACRSTSVGDSRGAGKDRSSCNLVTKAWLPVESDRAPLT